MYCLNGHYAGVVDPRSGPISTQPVFCRTCGAATINRCPHQDCAELFENDHTRVDASVVLPQMWEGSAVETSGPSILVPVG